ncbi:hypothetical protein [Clostridium haemolyticum]|uniref:hypothetical protein n=1 Tax=Clostridium haemolyticum TaxID=84025 RepID=UPI00057C532A|nr:hypothetical protein [Clostridium haemolyticum]
MSNIAKEINNILDGIVVVVKELIKKTRLNYTEIGTVINKNDNGTYKVRINDSTTDIKSLHGIEYKANDVVYILIMNQDFSKKLILDKVY